MGTDPNNADTDGDGLRDDMEIRLGLDPNDWDTDNDMLVDGNELAADRQSTDGHFVDTDNDGVDGTPDGPIVPHPGPPGPEPEDTDGDSINDDVEEDIGTDPNNPDTDGDGLFDGQEIKMGLDPNDYDTDNDLLLDGSEMGFDQASTDGHFVDSDSDGL